MYLLRNRKHFSKLLQHSFLELSNLALGLIVAAHCSFSSLSSYLFANLLKYWKIMIEWFLKIQHFNFICVLCSIVKVLRYICWTHQCDSLDPIQQYSWLENFGRVRVSVS
jgi:hypothetical protein